MFRLLSGIVLSAALVSPSLLAAHARQDRDDHQRSEQRHDDRDHDRQPYYDSGHRDWHQWNSDEERSYHQYAEHRHWDQDFWKLNEKQQDEYWKWRHKHPDSH